MLRVLRHHRGQRDPNARFNDAAMMSDSAFSDYGSITRYLT